MHSNTLVISKPKTKKLALLIRALILMFKRRRERRENMSWRWNLLRELRFMLRH